MSAVAAPSTFWSGTGMSGDVFAAESPAGVRHRIDLAPNHLTIRFEEPET